MRSQLDVYNLQLEKENREKIDQLLRVPSDESFSLFQKLKASAGRSSMNGLKEEEALRNAIRAVVNFVLNIRNPRIWGEGNACASDGKSFEVWDQNLMAEWRTRYKGYAVMVYWHVETNALSIYSQLKKHSASEAAAMIEGLIRHDTEMRVEKNFVDSHGQSEVAFAFCRLLNDFKLMPRLKGIKKEKLYLPDKGMTKQFPKLTGVLTRPIRWKIVEQQYDEMMKSTVAMKYGDANAFAILRRFSSINDTHPTYKALLELGKVEKTIYLCKYLPSRQMKQEVHSGLNVVENWNSSNEFIFYGRRGKLETNNPQDGRNIRAITPFTTKLSNSN